jgi:uncharacterized membrane protein YhaH (DUF805 family)
MYFSEICKNVAGEVWSGPMWAFLGAFIVLAVIFGIAVYAYWAIAWSTILKKLKYKKHWLAWIPVAQIAPILEVGGFHWAWIFLVFIPVLGWIALFVLVIISTWKIFEKRKYPGWLSLSMIIPKVGGILYLIAIGFVAWKNRKKR